MYRLNFRHAFCVSSRHTGAGPQDELEILFGKGIIGMKKAERTFHAC